MKHALSSGDWVQYMHASALFFGRVGEVHPPNLVLDYYIERTWQENFDKYELINQEIHLPIDAIYAKIAHKPEEQAVHRLQNMNKHLDYLGQWISINANGASGTGLVQKSYSTGEMVLKPYLMKDEVNKPLKSYDNEKRIVLPANGYSISVLTKDDISRLTK